VASQAVSPRLASLGFEMPARAAMSPRGYCPSPQLRASHALSTRQLMSPAAVASVHLSTGKSLSPPRSVTVPVAVPAARSTSPQPVVDIFASKLETRGLPRLSLPQAAGAGIPQANVRGRPMSLSQAPDARFNQAASAIAHASELLDKLTPAQQSDGAAIGDVTNSARRVASPVLVRSGSSPRQSLAAGPHDFFGSSAIARNLSTSGSAITGLPTYKSRASSPSSPFTLRSTRQPRQLPPQSLLQSGGGSVTVRSASPPRQLSPAVSFECAGGPLLTTATKTQASRLNPMQSSVGNYRPSRRPTTSSQWNLNGLPRGGQRR